jgi:serine O-acetyltransferase
LIVTWRASLATLRADVRAIFFNDPAATTLPEVLLYPGLHAIVAHRVAHRLYKRRVPFVPRLISQLARFITGIEIHPGARIGSGFFIDHGMGVVIGETTEIGDNVVLYQGVTLGGTGKQRGKRHPTIQDNVVVGVGAKVLGAITVGTAAKVGGGAVVVKDVPPYATAVGVPARIVAHRDPHTGTTRRVEDLPDPEGAMLRSLREKVLELEARLEELEGVTSLHELEHRMQLNGHGNGHHAEHHKGLSSSAWDCLDGNGKTSLDEEFASGSGI